MSGKIAARPVNVSAILGGDIRLEASTYLRDGYGLVRLARQSPNCASLGEVAEIWQPSRLAGYEMPAGKGLPFMTAGQVFEDFPRIRKWLAKPFVPQEQQRYVDSGWLLLSSSGVVGKVTAVYPHHLGVVITHDLLRIVPKDEGERGWLYAYMKTDFFTKVAQAAQYGHMIKHIEVAHAKGFPVIMPDEGVRREIGAVAVDAIGKRTRAWNLRDEAFRAFEEAIGYEESSSTSANLTLGLVRISNVFENRQRLDADSYVGEIVAVDYLIDGRDWDYLGNLTVDVVEPTRFKRFYGDSGIPFMGISELFDVNARPTKHIYAKLVKNWRRYMLEPGTLVMARSGQKYGILGRVLPITENHREMMGSDHLTRIYPDESKIRTGYLLTFLNSQRIGRPAVVRHAFGTSIPELAPDDIKRIRIPRLGDEAEGRIADLMDDSVQLSAEADRFESEAVRLAQEQIDAAIGATSGKC